MPQLWAWRCLCCRNLANVGVSAAIALLLEPRALSNTPLAGNPRLMLLLLRCCVADDPSFRFVWALHCRANCGNGCALLFCKTVCYGIPSPSLGRELASSAQSDWGYRPPPMLAACALSALMCSRTAAWPAEHRSKGAEGGGREWRSRSSSWRPDICAPRQSWCSPPDTPNTTAPRPLTFVRDHKLLPLCALPQQQAALLRKGAAALEQRNILKVRIPWGGGGGLEVLEAWQGADCGSAVTSVACRVGGDWGRGRLDAPAPRQPSQLAGPHM